MNFLTNLIHSNFIADNAIFLICVVLCLATLSFALVTVVRTSTRQDSDVPVIVLVGSMLILIASVLAEGVIYLRAIH